jgi:hypothetical protein
MSWRDAKQIAKNWLAELNLPLDLRGETIKLGELAERLTYQGSFRDMVLRAAKRQLRQRGALIEK